MSSIRLFILSSFHEFGPMHGHLLRAWAERMQVPLWTDISVGAVYGAMKRLAAEGLLREAGREQEGNRPMRQIYEITEEGRRALEDLRRAGLSDVWFKFDPFDLALTRMDAKMRKTLPALLGERLKKVQAMLAESRRVNEGVPAKVGLAKKWALRHTEYRLEAEVAYLTDLLKLAGDIAREKPHSVVLK
ncbi:MAG TPA: PadR family transcriptional regulator [Rhizomicrobium sp.]|jgi:DNA-binding PadR family transcriptional regulator|nr:PadR family transcriptional regulator [Rhizomicrobium sp.]